MAEDATVPEEPMDAHIADIEERHGRQISDEMKTFLKDAIEQSNALFAKGIPPVMHVPARLWYRVQNALFQTLPEGNVTPRELSESDSVIVREGLDLDKDLLVEPMLGEPINMEERRQNMFEKISQGQLTIEQLNNNVYAMHCDCCHKMTVKGTVICEKSRVRRQYQFLDDEYFFCDPETGEDFCVSCVNGHIDGLLPISSAEAIEENFGAYFDRVLQRSVRCFGCGDSLCDSNGHATEDFYVCKTNHKKTQCKRCNETWKNIMPWFYIQVRLIEGGQSLRIAVQRKPLSFVAIVNVVVRMKRWRSRAMERLYDPTCGLGAQLAKASFEDAAAEQATS